MKFHNVGKDLNKYHVLEWKIQVDSSYNIFNPTKKYDSLKEEMYNETFLSAKELTSSNARIPFTQYRALSHDDGRQGKIWTKNTTDITGFL